MKTKATPEQQAKAKERRAAFATLCKTVADMTPEQKAKYNDRAPVMTAEGHALSPTNQIILIYQKDDVSIVGGFQQWRNLGRAVTKGEAALAIWIPRTEKKDESKQPGEITEKDLHPGFFMGYVFDITQTHEIEKELS